jgi:hypothetical protein
MGMEASERLCTNEFVPAHHQVNGRHSAGLGITRHESAPATTLPNAVRPRVGCHILRRSEGSVRVLQLDRRLEVVVAAANVRLLEATSEPNGWRPETWNALRHVKQVVVC